MTCFGRVHVQGRLECQTPGSRFVVVHKHSFNTLQSSTVPGIKNRKQKFRHHGHRHVRRRSLVGHLWDHRPSSGRPPRPCRRKCVSLVVRPRDCPCRRDTTFLSLLGYPTPVSFHPRHHPFQLPVLEHSRSVLGPLAGPPSPSERPKIRPFTV